MRNYYLRLQFSLARAIKSFLFVVNLSWTISLTRSSFISTFFHPRRRANENFFSTLRCCCVGNLLLRGKWPLCVKWSADVSFPLKFSQTITVRRCWMTNERQMQPCMCSAASRVSFFMEQGFYVTVCCSLEFLTLRDDGECLLCIKMTTGNDGFLRGWKKYWNFKCSTERDKNSKY